MSAQDLKYLPKSVMASAKKRLQKELLALWLNISPIAALAGTAAAATGALNSFFTPPQQEEGESYEAYMARRKVAEDKFRQDNPQFFGFPSPNATKFCKQPGDQDLRA
jgi:hypothetical protein